MSFRSVAHRLNRRRSAYAQPLAEGARRLGAATRLLNGWGSGRAAFGRLRRSATVAFTAVQVYRAYKRTQKAVALLPEAERTAAWEAQHTIAARRIADTATRLRGLYVKAAQFIGTRADLLPESYITALSALQDRVPPEPYPVVRRVLREALGAEPEHVFAAFERRPIAAASLAQVHRARLHDGRLVAVKVQYPSIGRLVRLDLNNLALILGLVHRLEPNLDFRPLVEAIGRLVPLELDFINEGRNTETIGAALAHRGDVVTPAVVWQHTRPTVLVTEFVEGVKITDLAALRAAGLEPRRIAERLVDVWGEQVLRHAHFHADPHPGNLLALPDGRLALIDFGLSARLDRRTRDAIARLCRGTSERNPAEVMAAFESLGFHSQEDAGPRAYSVLWGNLLGSRGHAETVNSRLAKALRSFKMEDVPGEMLLVMRSLGLLSGISTTLGRPGSVMPAWVKYAAADERTPA